MDPLPISVNRNQLSLMHHAVGRVIANLEEMHKAGQLSSSDDTQKEKNIQNYGTDQYDEVLTKAKAIEDQLKSQIDAWNNDAEKSHPVSLALDSYQLKMLRSGIEQECNHSQNGEQRQSQSPSQEQLLNDIIEQLPEHSPQEDAD